MPKIMCPYCGKRNTVPMVYGYPGAELAEAQERGELQLGGCCIGDDMPKRFCKDCREEFDRQSNKLPLWTGFSFSVGGPVGESHSVVIRKGEADWPVRYLFSSGNDDVKLDNESCENAPPIQTLDDEQWNAFCGKLKKCYIAEWKKEYRNDDWIDGTYWSLQIDSLTEPQLVIYGKNDYPPYFNKLLRILSELTGKTIA